MILVALNVIVALFFAWVARRSLPPGIQYVRSGWLFIQTGAADKEKREQIEQRQRVEIGTRFMVGGLVRVLTGLLALFLAVTFGLTAIGLLFGI